MCAKIKICLEKIRKEVFRTGSMFMSNVMSVYFSNVIRRNRGGVSAGLTTLSSVADKFNFSDFFTETELYKQKRTRSFCLLGRRSASFLRLNEFFREPVIPNSFRNPTQRRLNVWEACGIFPKGDLTFGQVSGFSREGI